MTVKNKIDNFLNYFKSNPDWREKLSADPLNLLIKETDDSLLVIMKYNQIKTKWVEDIDDFAKLSRGTIWLKDSNGTPIKCICLAFLKFFNAQEGASDLSVMDWESAFGTLKIDGSLIRLYFNPVKNDWEFATNGCCDAEGDLYGFIAINDEEATKDSKKFIDLIYAAMNKAFNNTDWKKVFESIPKNYTIMFELVSPRNKIICNYDETKLYLLGARNMTTFEEITPNEFNEKYNLPFDTPTQFKIDVGANADEFYKLVESLPDNTEGIVIQDKYFHRVKMKREAYLNLHKLKGEQQLNENMLWDVVKLGTYDDILGAFPEYETVINDLKDIYIKLETKLKKFWGHAETYWKSLKDLEEKDRHKDFAGYVLRGTKSISSLLFSIKKDMPFEDAFATFVEKKSLDDVNRLILEYNV
jgi:hypothetical protein